MERDRLGIIVSDVHSTSTIAVGLAMCKLVRSSPEGGDSYWPALACGTHEDVVVEGVLVHFAAQVIEQFAIANERVRSVFEHQA